MSDDRRILTWSLNAGSTAYSKDLQQYSHKIYSIGLHEFGVTQEGKIYDYPTGSTALYFNADGSHTGVLMKVANENDNINYPSIKWYLQTICFGWTKVSAFLDNNVLNAEGRYPQDQYIYEMGKIFDLYATSRTTHTPLHWEGLELDIEASMTGINTIEPYDERYCAFIQKVKNQLCIPRGLKLRVNSFAMWGDQVPYYYRFHNYPLFSTLTDSQGNAAIDELQLMTYDFSWSGSAPGASTPTWWFKEVADWASQNFDKKNNPNAKLTIDKVFLGCAGYGYRWGLYDPNNLNGKSLTFRNVLGWQNGQYRHYHMDGSTYVYENQDFLLQNGYEDPVSKNQILLPHVYDFVGAQYGNIRNETAAHGLYNEKNYITSYSKTQQPIFTGVKQVVTNKSSSSGKVASSGTVDREVAGTTYTFNGFQCNKRQYIPGNGVCTLETTPEGVITYSVNPGVGTFKVIALTTFPWYTQTRIGGDIGGVGFTIGGSSLPDYYPYMFKASHWFDMGSFTFNGSTTITIHGELGDYGTPIYGFVICDAFDHNFKGGVVDFNINPQPFKGKDGNNLAMPTTFALTTEILRQEARPAILWEDRFSHYVGKNPYLENTTYYREQGTYSANGSTYSNGECVYTYEDGYTYGSWTPHLDSEGIGYAYFDYTVSVDSGQLIFNHQFNGNVQVNADVLVETGSNVGVRFGSTGAGNGYILMIDFDQRLVKLMLENPYPNTTTIATETLNDAVTVGDRLNIQVTMHNGQGYFSMGANGGLHPVFGGEPITLDRTAGGACGIYAYHSKVRVYVLGISTTDRWETMEKFAVEVDGTTYNFGELSRPGYSYDEYGYLIYSGLDENVTRADPTDISLDYEFQIINIPGFTGAKTLTLRLTDAGLWFANFFIGDAEGCSIAYVGDAETFNTLMNIAVNDHGAKGIGLWVLGQEDPKLFERVPDVVAPH